MIEEENTEQENEEIVDEVDTQAGEGDSKFFSQHHYIEQNDRSQNNEG